MRLSHDTVLRAGNYQFLAHTLKGSLKFSIFPSGNQRVKSAEWP
jgi:hypothetical protein